MMRPVEFNLKTNRFKHMSYSLSRENFSLLNEIQRSNGIDINDHMIKEWIACKTNPLYFILNYVYLPEIGGRIKYSSNIMHKKIRRVVRVVMRLHSCLLMATRQLGKALYINTPILQPNGQWTIMGKLKAGDYVLDSFGSPVRIVAVTDFMYNRPCYILKFSTGEEIIADENHVWNVSYVDHIDKLISTKQMYELISNNIQILISNQNRKTIDAVSYILVESVIRTESVPVRCIQVDSEDGMFLCGKTLIPTHNSSIAAALLSWAINFYPGNRALILNMQKRYAQENLSKIKFIHDNLPSWMKFSRASRSEIKEYFELRNGSRVDTLYPSSTTPPDSIARSLTLPILYIDEMAFIPHIDKIYGAAQPTLNRAREQAKKNNYPYFILGTSTPNGVEGTGKFFADLWENAMDSDEFFITDSEMEDWVDEETFNQLIDAPNKNNFVKIRYHWSEDPTKDETWYMNQKRELNFDMRKIRQELDLQFVGGQYCIFDDEILSAMESRRRYMTIHICHGAKLDLYVDPSELKSNDYYFIGVDTASSLRGAFNAIEIFSFKEFNQIAELKVKLGSLTKYAEVVEGVFQWLYKIVGDRIILCIENNSIGKAIIEGLLYHPKEENFSYSPFIYMNREKNEYGINTNTKTKELIVSSFYEYIVDNPKIVKSNELIAQLHRLERSNSGVLTSKTYTDLFMASGFCAYVRKLKFHELSAIVDYSTEEIQQSLIDEVKLMTSVSPKNMMKSRNMQLLEYEGEDKIILTNNEDDILKDWTFFGG